MQSVATPPSTVDRKAGPGDESFVLVRAPSPLPPPRSMLRRLSLAPLNINLKRTLSTKLMRSIRRSTTAPPSAEARDASASLSSLSNMSAPTLVSARSSSEAAPPATAALSDAAEPANNGARRPVLQHAASSPPAPPARPGRTRASVRLGQPITPIPIVPEGHALSMCPSPYPARSPPTCWTGSPITAEPDATVTPMSADTVSSPVTPRTSNVWICSRPPSVASADTPTTLAASPFSLAQTPCSAHGPGLPRSHSTASMASLTGRRATRPLIVRCQSTGHGAKIDENGAVMYLSLHSDRVTRPDPTADVEPVVDQPGSVSVEAAEFGAMRPTRRRESYHASTRTSMYAQSVRSSTYTLSSTADERGVYRGASGPNGWNWRWVLL